MSLSVPSVAPISADGYVPQTVTGALLIDAMRPWLTRDLAIYLDGAVGAILDPLWLLVQDHGIDGDPDFVPGYGTLLDPLTCPFASLPYLAAFVGVDIPTGTDEATARSLVLAESGLNRGTPSAVVAAARRTLAGTQSVQLIERTYVDGTPNASWFLLLVNPSEVVSLPALIAAVNNVKLSGLLFSVVQQSAWTWLQATGIWSADIMSWSQTASTQP